MKKLQKGRSMIEMLGVLAIIGVLSIGGLAGYTMAMNRHRANQILDYVSRCAVAAQTAGDGYFIGAVTKELQADQTYKYTSASTTCGALLPLEVGPNGLSATGFTIPPKGPADLEFTITTPKIDSNDIRTALLNRDNINVNIAETTVDGGKGIIFTFRK